MQKLITLLTSLAILGTVGCNKPAETGSTSGGAASTKRTIALMPKSKGNAYFISCKQGADQAAQELKADLLFDGPTDPDPAKQNEIIENWITLGVDVIAVQFGFTPPAEYRLTDKQQQTACTKANYLNSFAPSPPPHPPRL